MIDNDKKQLALQELSTILQKHNLNSILTTNAENDKPFIIIESWVELATIQRELNRMIAPEAYYRNAIDYYNIEGNEAFQNMSFEVNHIYRVPEGLLELDDVIDWGFSDEWSTCSNCYKAIFTSPYYPGDKPRYAVLNNEVLCDDCITNECEQEYIDSVTNDYKKTLNTNIISESKLEELGWIKQEQKYESGMYKGQIDSPKKVWNEFKELGDTLFTYESGQFDINFWIWIRKSTSEDANFRR